MLLDLKINKLTRSRRVLLEKLIMAQLAKKLPASMRLLRFLTVPTKSQLPKALHNTS
jgi:hypothetical protein